LLDAPWGEHLDQALPQIERLETQLAAGWTLEGAIGSHRDLHPTNLLRLASGELALVDWDAAGPVIPRKEVACFALVFGKRDGNDDYDPAVVSAFIQGYRHAGAEFAFDGPGDLALAANGLLWWTEQNVRRALALPTSAEQALLTDALVSALERVPNSPAEQAAVLADCA
jgi:hypothetical protein